MICDVCKISDSDVSLFATGCNSYKLDSIVKHEKSDSHIKASLISLAKSTPIAECKAANIIKII